jgi:hypothetical protein
VVYTLCSRGEGANPPSESVLRPLACDLMTMLAARQLSLIVSLFGEAANTRRRLGCRTRTAKRADRGRGLFGDDLLALPLLQAVWSPASLQERHTGNIDAQPRRQTAKHQANSKPKRFR